MAKLEIELSEYDMMREAKSKAEARVSELTKEVEKLKDNSSNVVVRNRYYLPQLDYDSAAAGILKDAYRLVEQSTHGYLLSRSYCTPDFMFSKPEGTGDLAEIIKRHLKNMLNLRASYYEDAVVSEIRGFDDVVSSVRNKIEDEYRQTMENRKHELEESKQAYDKRACKVQEAVKAAETALAEKYEKDIKELKEKYEKDIKLRDTNIAILEEKNSDLSKTSEQRLAEALDKLHKAQEEVAKYSKPRFSFLGLCRKNKP